MGVLVVVTVKKERQANRSCVDAQFYVVSGYIILFFCSCRFSFQRCSSFV